MIKKLMLRYLTCIFLFFVVSNYAQESDENEKIKINAIAKKMFVDMNNRDFDAIIDMTYPKVFNIASKEQMKTVIKSTFEGNEELTIGVPKTIPDYKISEIYNNEKESLKFAFVSYNMRMKMTFHKQEFDDESKKMMITYMKSKGMDVKFISKNSIDVLMQDRIIIIIKDKLTKNKWTMINYDSDSPLFYQMIPSGLIEEAKKYKQDLMLESKKNSENLKN